MAEAMNSHYTFVVVGGGIAGISCVETLAFLNEEASILLVTSSEVVKVTSSAVHLTRTVVELSVEEANSETITKKFSNVTVLIDVVTRLNYPDRCIETEKQSKIHFEKLCICSGGRPNLIQSSHPYVIGIRDTESVVEFEKRIKTARRIMIVGNGGIASEIVHEVKGVDKVWVVKDNHISKTFIDAGAADFFEKMLREGRHTGETVIRRVSYTTHRAGESSLSTVTNPALGPDWHKRFHLRGSLSRGDLTMEFATEIASITSGDGDWPVRVELANKSHYDVDFVVSATGVIPNSEVFSKDNANLKLGDDGGILVDWKMETSLSGVFAAGDVCCAGWDVAPHWHQMRLWTQARQMGAYGAKCMTAALSDQTVLQDFCFEIFTHVTKLYGFKVILLGLFNGQKLGNQYDLLLRVTAGKEYVKIVLKDGKMQGALLIGETDLEEMCENLILNQLDLTPFGEDLLDPDIDIEDYFD